MKRNSFALVAPIALTLSACGDTADDSADTAPLEGDPIAAIDAPDGTSWLEVANENDQGGVVLGNPDAPLKLIEYASHTCGGCALFAETGSPALKRDYVETGIVSYEMRPLLRDPLDVTISAMVRCGSPEGFHALADQAWGNLQQFGAALQSNGAAYEAAMNAPPENRFVQLAQAAGLIDFFAARGISADQARTCLSDGEAITEMAELSSRVASENEVNSTPTFFLNGRRLDAVQWPELEPVLQRAGAR